MQKRFNENFNSIAVFIKHNNYNIFLGGDVTCSSFDFEPVKELSIKMLNQIYQKHNISHIDIYKSCHHGGTGTNTPELCKLLKANYAVITNTARWLDTYTTFDSLKDAFENVKILT
jgi:beta-lactamase superfamily II metal-dependent hydrolase